MQLPGSNRRVLDLQRAMNFRDMGGYRTFDGMYTRWNKMFRSGHLARLTNSDSRRLDDLGLAAVFDFRSEDERRRYPSVKGSAVPVYPLSISPRADYEQLVKSWIAGEIEEAQILALQDEEYSHVLYEHGHQYREMFARILSHGGGAVLMHCTGGKDRTGLGAALLLSALGVVEEEIYGDYLLSLEAASLSRWFRKISDEYLLTRPVGEPDPIDRARELFGVRHKRLQRAFDAMRDRAGSVAKFLEDDLGLRSSDRQTLRTWYLAREAHGS